jgi:hypothetical protein
MKDIRFNTTSGFIESIGRSSTSLEFIEWWGKEGMQFDFYNPMDDEVKTISLTKDEIHALVTATIASNFVDVDSAKKDAEEMKVESDKRREEYEKNKNLALLPDQITGLGNLDRLNF